MNLFIFKYQKFISGQRSAVSGQRSAVSGQRSAVSGQRRSAVSSAKRRNCYANSAFSRACVLSYFSHFYLFTIFIQIYSKYKKREHNKRLFLKEFFIVFFYFYEYIQRFISLEKAKNKRHFNYYRRKILYTKIRFGRIISQRKKTIKWSML